MEPRFEELAGRITKDVTDGVIAAVNRHVTESIAAAELRLTEHVRSSLDAAEGRLAEHVRSNLERAEDRLAAHVEGSLAAAERRLSAQARVNVEEVKSQAQLAAESYAGLLNSINQHLRQIDATLATKFEDHGSLLANHETRIKALENTPG